MKTKLFELVNDFDDLTYSVHCAVELLKMCHTTIIDGPFSPCQDYFDGLYAAICYLSILNKELEATSQEVTNVWLTAKKESSEEERRDAASAGTEMVGLPE